MDPTESLREAENALRDFINDLLEEKYGGDWLGHCGVTADRVQDWRRRQEEDGKRIPSGNVDPRVLYYSDFHDLGTIIGKNWELFKPCFGNKKRFEVYLDIIEGYRNPDAHRRRLMPYQVQLLQGISGEIRSAITNFKSNKSAADEFFPRIEYVQDSLGSLARARGLHIYDTKRTLRPGDEVLFVVTAWDPLGEELEYLFDLIGHDPIADWSDANEASWRVSKEQVAKTVTVETKIRSRREYHARTGYDDSCDLMYTVLPR